MENLLAQIDTLSDSDLVEAASYYLANRTGAYSNDEIEELSLQCCEELGVDFSALETIRNDLSLDPESYRQLLRFLLKEAAQESEEQRQQVVEAMEGVGQKQVVVEVLVAIALGTVVIMQHLHYTRGKVSEEEKTDFEVRPDGGIHSSKTKKTIYANPSSSLGSFFALLKKAWGGDNQSS